MGSNTGVDPGFSFERTGIRPNGSANVQEAPADPSHHQAVRQVAVQEAGMMQTGDEDVPLRDGQETLPEPVELPNAEPRKGAHEDERGPRQGACEDPATR
ncbi:hypothetical protein [Rhizobium subbaraonis]|nr:hypothetical protein [Rhizobium subbaraonis]